MRKNSTEVFIVMVKYINENRRGVNRHVQLIIIYCNLLKNYASRKSSCMVEIEIIISQVID